MNNGLTPRSESRFQGFDENQMIGKGWILEEYSNFDGNGI